MNCLIIKSTEGIFLTDYPGIRFLIPKYLESIEKILSGKLIFGLSTKALNLLQKLILYGEESTDSPKIRNTMAVSAIRILKSVICMGFALEDMEIAAKGGNNLNLGLIREKGFKITYNVLEVLKNIKEVDPRTKLYTDSEFQHNLHTVIIAIIFHECLVKYDNRPSNSEISLEVISGLISLYF